MHFCTAYIALANDEKQVMYRDQYAPVSWPEIEVLRQVHGDEAVRNVRPFVRVEQAPKAERERLALIYGPVVGQQVWTGRNPNMEMDAAELADDAQAGMPWKNPLTGMVELTPEAEVKVDPAAKKRPRDPKGRLLPAEQNEQI